MATIALTPLIIKDALLQIGADNFEKAVSNVTLTPTANAITWTGISGSFTDTAVATWTASITFVQDHDTPGSLSNYLFDNEGATVSAVFKPRSGSGPSYSVSLIITPGAIGGAGNATAETTVSLGITGKPVRVAGTAVVPTVTLAAPASGPIAGGTLVKVTGQKFTGTTGVKFGAVVATNFTVDSDGTLYVVAPAAAAGSKPITVTNATGVSTTSAPYTFV